MGFAEVWLKSQRFERFRIRLLLPRLGWFVEVVYETRRCRESRVCECELGVKFDRLIVKIDR